MSNARPFLKAFGENAPAIQDSISKVLRPKASSVENGNIVQVTLLGGEGTKQLGKAAQGACLINTSSADAAIQVSWRIDGSTLTVKNSGGTGAETYDFWIF